MFSENDKISIRQMQILLILDLFGTAVITLPRQTALSAGNDAWICVLLGSSVMIFFTLFFTILGERYPNQTVVEIAQKLFTKPIGFLISLGLAIKLIFGAALELRLFCEMLGEYMLFHTPIAVTAIAMLLVCSYVAAEGYECRARTGEVLFVFVFLPFLILLLLAIFTADYTNLQPIMSHNTNELLKGTWQTMLSFQGIEFLFFIFPYLQSPKKAKKSVITAGIVIGVFMTLITLLTIAVFGEHSVISKLFPVLNMMDSLQLPGAFLDRQDIFMLWFCMASIFASVSAGLFFITVILERMQSDQKKKVSARKCMFFVLFLVLGISLLPQDIAQTYESIEKLKRYGGIFYIFVLPIVLLLLDNIKRGKQV